MIDYIEHTGIAAQDPAALAQWYRDVLGMRLLRQTGPTTYFLGYARGACLEIYAARSDAPQTADNYVRGLTHLALYVRDFAAAYQALLEKGVQSAAEPVIRPDLKLALLRDPEGNLFHITNRDAEIISQ